MGMEKKTNFNYIKTIADMRSISAAAEVLGISQPALSAHLKKLETELGTVLFDRSSKPLELTEAGHAYLEYAEKSVALERELAQSISDIENLETGNLIIGGAGFFNLTFLPLAIAEFSKGYPNVSLEIIDDKVPELTKKALNGAVDLFFTPAVDDREAFEYEQLLDEKVFLCIPKAWEVNDRLKAKAIGRKDIANADSSVQFPTLTAREFKALQDSTFITLKENQQIGQIMRELFDKFGFEPKKTIVSEQTLTSMGLASAGAGVCLLTETSIRSGHARNLLTYYLPDREICRRSIYIAYPKNRRLSKAAQEFIEILKQINSK